MGDSETDARDTEWGVKTPRPQVLQPTPARAQDPSNTAETVDIAIVGGGLAGLAVAIGLTRQGLRCKVYERAPRLRSSSQGMLLLATNGLAALEQICPELPGLVASAGSEHLQSLRQTIQADGTVVEKQVNYRRQDGRRNDVLIRWHALQQVLASLLETDTIKTDKSLTGFDEDEHGVTLHFGDGSSVKCQVVLACDGTFSVARKQMFPNENDAPIDFGQVNWNAIIPTSDLRYKVHPPNTVRHIGHPQEPRWQVFLNDCGADCTFWQLRVSDPSKALALSGSEGRGGLGLKGVKDKLLSVISSCPDVVEVLQRIPEERIFERCIIGRSPARAWLSTGGRVALVGDAAHGMHPMIGQGGNSAFESAAALVMALSECNDNLRAGLQFYESRRKPKADIVQRFSNLMGCWQAAGTENMSLEDSKRMIDWIKGAKPKTEPPQEAMIVLESFDPCTQPGVSRMI